MIHSHNCLEHLIIDEHEWIEPHGERCHQAWWECAVCGQQFTQTEADRLFEQDVLYNMPRNSTVNREGK